MVNQENQKYSFFTFSILPTLPSWVAAKVAIVVLPIPGGPDKRTAFAPGFSLEKGIWKYWKNRWRLEIDIEWIENGIWEIVTTINAEINFKVDFEIKFVVDIIINVKYEMQNRDKMKIWIKIVRIRIVRTKIKNKNEISK